ncbi:MAG TPA: rod shape-determining protein RodA, partial [Solibacterales bacterium]|nr:rod shape-determining protein RodA [Bryobacterales bacterium]
MPQRRWFRDFDWPLLAVTLVICGLGLLQIYSATLERFQGSWYKQAIYIGLGIILMWIISSIDYHTLMAQVPALYIASVSLLLAVLLIGQRAFGSTRWIRLPGNLHLQVSEFAKLVIILLVARYMTERRTGNLDLKELLKIGGLVLVPMLLIMKEPDLGTALTYLPILAMG